MTTAGNGPLPGGCTWRAWNDCLPAFNSMRVRAGPDESWTATINSAIGIQNMAGIPFPSAVSPAAQARTLLARRANHGGGHNHLARVLLKKASIWAQASLAAS